MAALWSTALQGAKSNGGGASAAASPAAVVPRMERIVGLDERLAALCAPAGGGNGEWAVRYTRTRTVAALAPTPTAMATRSTPVHQSSGVPVRAEEVIRVVRTGNVREFVALVERHGLTVVLATRSETGMSPLHAAVYAPGVHMARLVVTLGRLLNVIETSTGNTPLHTAASARRREVFDVLRAAGTDVSLANLQGQTALDVLAHTMGEEGSKKGLRKLVSAMSAAGRLAMGAGGVRSVSARAEPEIVYVPLESDEPVLFSILLADSVGKKLQAGAATTGWGLLALAASKIGLDGPASRAFAWALRRGADSGASLVWLRMDDPLAGQVDSLETATFLLRVRYPSFTLPLVGAVSSVGAHLLRQQLITDVLTAGGRLMGSLGILQLAALQLQLNYGNHRPDVHNTGFLDSLIDKYLPRDMLGADLAALQALIFYFHRMVFGVSRDEVNRRIDEVLGANPLVGGTLFVCQLAQNAGGADDVDVALFVTSVGLLFAQPLANVHAAAYPSYKLLPYDKIKRWKAIATAVIVQTIAEWGTGGTEQVLQFVTPDAAAVLQLMSDYYTIYTETAIAGRTFALTVAVPPSSSLPVPESVGPPRAHVAPDPEGSRMQLMMRKFLTASRSLLGRPAAGSVLAQLYVAFVSGLPLPAIIVDNARHVEAFLTSFRETWSYVSPVTLGVFREDMHSIETVDLSGCALGSNAGVDSGKMKLLNECMPWLRSLKLCACNLGPDAGMRVCHLIGSMTPMFEALDLSNNALGPDALHEIIAALGKSRHRLKRLRLSATGLVDKNCDALSQLFVGMYDHNTTRELDISFNRITDKGFAEFVAAFERNRHIRALSVAGTMVTERALVQLMDAVIGPNVQLNAFAAGEIKLSPKGAESLVRMGTLCNATELDISGCDLPKKAVNALFEGLAATNKNTVTTLRVAGNAVDKAAIQLLVHGLGTNLKRMVYLDLAGAEIGKLWGELAAALGGSALEALSLANTGMSDKSLSTFCAALNGNRTLRNLNLASNPKLTKGVGLTPLSAVIAAGACRIQNLLLMNCKLRDTQLEQLSVMLSQPTSLFALQLDDNLIEEAAIVAFLGMVDFSPHLQFSRLDLRNNPGSQAQSVTSVVPLTHATCVVSLQ